MQLFWQRARPCNWNGRLLISAISQHLMTHQPIFHRPALRRSRKWLITIIPTPTPRGLFLPPRAPPPHYSGPGASRLSPPSPLPGPSLSAASCIGLSPASRPAEVPPTSPTGTSPGSHAAPERPKSLPGQVTEWWGRHRVIRAPGFTYCTFSYLSQCPERDYLAGR